MLSIASEATLGWEILDRRFGRVKDTFSWTTGDRQGDFCTVHVHTLYQGWMLVRSTATATSRCIIRYQIEMKIVDLRRLWSCIL